MDTVLDTIWERIESALSALVAMLDTVLSPLEMLGPGFVIFVAALFVVGATKLASRLYVTQRYLELKKEFEHWQNIRNEAMKHPDIKKGKALAKNIDQARLNKAYYDYFFEGFLKNMITNVLPIVLTAAYFTQVYTPETLAARFGDKWVFTFFPGSSSPVHVSSLFWFVICLFFLYILLTAVNLFYRKNVKKT